MKIQNKDLTGIIAAVISALLFAVACGPDETESGAKDAHIEIGFAKPGTAQTVTVKTGVVTQENFSKIKTGMTVQKVKSILGEPSYTVETEFSSSVISVQHNYQNDVNTIDIFYKNGVVTSKEWDDL